MTMALVSWLHYTWLMVYTAPYCIQWKQYAGLPLGEGGWGEVWYDCTKPILDWEEGDSARKLGYPLVLPIGSLDGRSGMPSHLFSITGLASDHTAGPLVISGKEWDGEGMLLYPGVSL